MPFLKLCTFDNKKEQEITGATPFTMNGHGKPPPPPRTMTAVSYMNRLLSSITLVALGAIGGFAIFHSALQYRIELTKYNHNETLEIVKRRFVESEKERKRCLEIDDGRLREIADLRGRLDAQYKSWHDLIAAQRSTVSKEWDDGAHVQQFREVYDRDQQTLVSLKGELDQKDRELIAIEEMLISMKGDLQTQHRTKMELKSEVMRLGEENKRVTGGLNFEVKQRDQQITSMEQSLNILDEQKGKLEVEIQQLRKKIQQRDEQLEIVNNNFDALQNQKERLEQYVTEMKDKTGKLESQIENKDNELLKYREEGKEGELETQLVNFREGMLELLKEKIQEIQDLEKRVSSLNQEKVDLETKLENWREGMLELVKEKLHEIENLKSILAESQESTEISMKEIDLARSEQIEAEEFVRVRLDMIDQNDDLGEEEVMRELMEEIESVRSKLRESQEWVVALTKDIESREADQEKSGKLLTDKTNELNNLKLQIERDQESIKQKISKLESNLSEAQKLVVEKKNEIERLNLELGEFKMEINNLKSVIVPGITTSEMMTKHIQQRDGMMCRQLYVNYYSSAFIDGTCTD